MEWLRVFGFAPEKILELQVSLPSKRTILLDVALDDRNAWVRWFQDVAGGILSASVTPLGRLIEFSSHRQLRSLTASSGGNFLYAKIGYQDAVAFPELLPGSIVRANSQLSEGVLSQEKGRTPAGVFLIEHSRGFWCCGMHVLESDRIVPFSNQLPYGHVEFRVPDEARILGVVDMEMRRTHEFLKPDVPREFVGTWKPESITQKQERLGSLLQRARSRAALSFREASAMSREIARLLNDDRYFVSPGSLSDYEAQDIPPRHFHKIVTLCSVYGIRLNRIIAAAGINLEKLGRDAIPTRFFTATSRAVSGNNFAASEPAANNLNLAQLAAEFDEFPVFLRESLKEFCGMKQLSLRDFFWAGNQGRSLNRSLHGAVLFVVNRRKKKPFRLATLERWRQPLFMLVRRNGTYLCSSCALDHDMVVIYENQLPFREPERLRNYAEVEVVGEVVMVVRKIP